jgi:anti-sigma factor RsiW
MRRHPDFEVLKGFADGALEAPERERVTAHLERCTECRRAILTVRTVGAVAREVWAPSAPPEALQRILARRAAGERRILPRVTDGDTTSARPAPTWRAPLRRSAPWAAALLVTLVGGAAALSGPLRQWLAARERPARPAAAPVIAPSRPAAESTPPAAPVARVSGIAVPRTGGELWVAVEGADAGLRIRVRLVEGEELEVRGVGAASSSVYRPRAGGVGVTTAGGGGELQVDIPRAAPRVVVRVNGVLLVAKDGAQLRVLAPRADTVGAEIVLTPVR